MFRALIFAFLVFLSAIYQNYFGLFLSLLLFLLFNLSQLKNYFDRYFLILNIPFLLLLVIVPFTKAINLTGFQLFEFVGVFIFSILFRFSFNKMYFLKYFTIILLLFPAIEVIYFYLFNHPIDPISNYLIKADKPLSYVFDIFLYKPLGPFLNSSTYGVFSILLLHLSYNKLLPFGLKFKYLLPYLIFLQLFFKSWSFFLLFVLLCLFNFKAFRLQITTLLLIPLSIICAHFFFTNYSRLTFDYLYFVLIDKFNYDLSSPSVALGGDFGLFTYFSIFGLLGIIPLLSFFFYPRRYYPLILYLLLSSFHYFFFGSLLAQIFLGLILENPLLRKSNFVFKYT